MASKHRDIGLKFRHRSTPNTRRVTKDVGFFFWEGGGGVPYIYIYARTYLFLDIYRYIHMSIRIHTYRVACGEICDITAVGCLI